VTARPTVNVWAVPLGADADDPEGYHATYAKLGPLIGSRHLRASVYELPPGESVCPYHYENDEEWLLVLGGHPSVRHPNGTDELEPGDVICFPSGPEGAHKVSNHSSATARVIILSTAIEPGVAVYPDSGKIGVWPPGKLFRLADAVDYWEGEL